MGNCTSSESAVQAPSKHDPPSGSFPTTRVELEPRPSTSSTEEASASHSEREQSHHQRNFTELSSIIISERNSDDLDLASNVVNFEAPFGKAIEDVYDEVHTGAVLGEGLWGPVREVTHKVTGIKYAVKCMDLEEVNKGEEGLQQLKTEVFAMCQLDHPNIVRLDEVYESLSEIYLVQELLPGGELFDRLEEREEETGEHYTEQECASLIKQITDAVRYIHSKGIIHRDLKLENFLFSSRDADSELKMIDFGLSKHFKFGDVQHEAVGTPYTVAPEVIRGSYDEKCDVWAIGVITYLLLSGDTPFGGDLEQYPGYLQMVRENILKGSYTFEPEEVWQDVSEEAKDFIRTLLVTDPTKRPSSEEVQQLPWLQNMNRKSLQSSKLNPNVVNALVTFKEYSGIRKLLCEVLSYTLLPEQIQGLRKEFEKIDVNGSGEIDLSEMKKVLMDTCGSNICVLNENDVEDLFNAICVRSTNETIHWHEFIAAASSQCSVDDRNLRLAFDRLDSDHKGYITFEDLIGLMGNDGRGSEESIRRMFNDGLEACKSTNARFTYEDFLLLMKGQAGEIIRKSSKQGSPALLLPSNFEPIPEENEVKPLHSSDKPRLARSLSQLLFTPNRNLYTAHRQMRVSILEASKQFEEKKAQRLIRERQKEVQVGAGLVMKRGETKQLSTSSVRDILQKREKEQQRLLDKARRRNKKKTISDLSDMIGPLQSSKTSSGRFLCNTPGSGSPNPNRSCPTTPETDHVRMMCSPDKNIPALPILQI